MDIIIKAICAGIMIGLGAMLNLKIGGILGAVCFSLGLLTICALGWHLFTGKIATILEKKMKIGVWCLIFLGNWLGVLLVVLATLVVAPELCEQAAAIASARIATVWYANVVRGIICGIFVQIAVSMWGRWHEPLCVIMPIAAFILIGGAHCIADLYYLTLGGYGLHFLQIGEVLVGNVIGAGIASAGILHRVSP